MEGSKIAIFENFAVTTVVMPYYGSTHQAFLLLSKLSKGVRSKLYEFYDEFVFAMKKYCVTLSCLSKSDISKFRTPCDLFQYDLALKNNIVFDIFIEFICNLNESKGNYFGSHYMHKKLTLSKNILLVECELIESLLPYVDIMKSIRVCCNIEFIDESAPPTFLLGTIISFKKYVFYSEIYINYLENILINVDLKLILCMISIINFKGILGESITSIPHYINCDFEQPNLNFEPFKRVFSVCENISRFQENLTANNITLISKSSIFIDNFEIDSACFISLLSSHFDLVTKIKVNYIKYYLFENEISESEINALNEIQSSSITFSRFIFSDIQNNSILRSFYSRIIPCMKTQKLAISLANLYNSCDIKLVFRNAIIKIFDPQANNPVFAKCSAYICQLSMYRFDKCCRIKQDSNGSYFFYCSDAIKQKFTNLKLIIDKEEQSKAASCFLNCSINSENCELIIPLKNLSKVNLYYVSDIINNFDINKESIKVILHSKNIYCQVESINEIIMLKRLLSDQYLNIQYQILCRNRKKYLIYDTDKPLLDEIDFNNISLSSINCPSILSPNEYNLICTLLASSKTQFRLESIILNFQTLNECLNVIKILSVCINLKDIVLRFKNSEKDPDKEKVKIAIKNFIKRNGPINILSVTEI